MLKLDEPIQITDIEVIGIELFYKPRPVAAVHTQDNMGTAKTFLMEGNEARNFLLLLDDRETAFAFLQARSLLPPGPVDIDRTDLAEDPDDKRTRIRVK
jgi:hypothetical protein